MPDNDAKSVLCGISDIDCRECGCQTVIVNDVLGNWIECTVCAWAVPLHIGRSREL